MRAEARAVGIDQGWLAAAPGPTTTLGIIRGGRRDISHIDHVKLGDVHTQFHGWRTEEDRQVRRAEPFFTLLPDIGLHLGRMFSGFQTGTDFGKRLVKLNKVPIAVGIELAFVGHSQRIDHRLRSIARLPDHHGRRNLVTADFTFNLRRSNLFDQAPFFKSAEEVNYDRGGIFKPLRLA